MRSCHLLLLAVLLPFAACTSFGFSAQGGYSMLSLDGDLGYESGSSTLAIQQDLESGFGLGDEQGSPYARLGFDFGVPTLTASAFMFEDEGTGMLTANFGSNLTAGTSVRTDFELMSARAALAFDIPLGPVTVAPGLAVNFVDLSVHVSDSLGIASEDVQLQAPLPMLFARAEVELGLFTLIGEGGYIQVDIEDIEAEMLDLEALVQLNAFGPVDLFAGYRMIDLQGDGLIDGDSFDLDLGLSGFFIGGGFTF